MPVNELVRLVRVYSTPWEEKSAALKKLHEDYESKQRQLNIAIKRLQLVDAHVSGKLQWQVFSLFLMMTTTTTSVALQKLPLFYFSVHL